MTENKITLYNGNGKQYEQTPPAVIILGYINDGALAHILENTGLEFRKTLGGYTAKPKNFNQIAALFMIYNFKTKYYNNSIFKNTLMLKSDYHVGFDVDSICSDCVKYNNIQSDIPEDGRLAC